MPAKIIMPALSISLMEVLNITKLNHENISLFDICTKEAKSGHINFELP